MSRFKGFSPRQKQSSDQSFDEGDITITQNHQVRDFERNKRDTESLRSVFGGSSTSGDSTQHARIPNTLGNVAHTPERDSATPWARLKRLANTNNSPPTPFPLRSSGLTHSSNSSDSFIGSPREEVEEYARSPDSLQSISRSLQKIKRDSPFTDRSINIDGEKSELNSVANRTLFTSRPDKSRSQEVADGYISPPESRQVSPDNSFNKSPSLYQKALYRSSSLSESPTPSISSIDRRTSTSDLHYNLSPKSRITRTLQEIQAELADSREGIEAIESRLGVLEKHESTSREMIGMHVKDCIKSMADELEADVSVLPSLDTEFEEDETDDEGEIVQVSKERLTLTLPISSRTILCSILGVLAAEYLLMVGIRELSQQRILSLS